jgi:hypothetical protein
VIRSLEELGESAAAGRHFLIADVHVAGVAKVAVVVEKSGKP